MFVKNVVYIVTKRKQCHIILSKFIFLNNGCLMEKRKGFSFVFNQNS